MSPTAPPLRLLWLTENYPPQRGGMAQSCDRIVDSLRSRGVFVDLVHLWPRAAQWSIEQQQMGRRWVCPTRPDPAHALQQLWAQLQDPAHSWTHVVAFGGTLPLTAGPVLAAWLGVPFVACIRGNDFDLGVFSPRRRVILQEAFARAAEVACVSQDKVRQIKAFYPDTSAVWTPNGIDFDSWQPLTSEREKAATWRQSVVAPGQQVLGLFGQLKAKKGCLFFLKALLQSGQAERFHLLMAGELEPVVLEWLSREPRIQWTRLPFLDRMQLLQHYVSCDWLVLPSFYDGTPNVLLEASALSIPVIASRAGGMGDGLEDRVHGLFFATGDRHACRWAIHTASEMPSEERQKLGQTARQWVETHASAAQEAQNYIDLLERTLSL